MNNTVREIEPKELWNNFADLNAIPRASKKEERVIEFILNFGKNLGLETLNDEVGNVIIKKPATAGMENRKVVALQSHLDMVHQKNGDTEFDFNTQGIEMYVDGDWVKANGTTLGADNGIGVASIMTILASKTIIHPPLEALFTIDEETGMTGALGLKSGLLNAEIMLNLDTEDDNELTIGCAGGVDVTATGTYDLVDVNKMDIAKKITLKGLTGGHSGMDIFNGRANANKLMNRILWLATNQFNIQINSIDGGSLRNAIPRESKAIIVINNDYLNDFETFIKEQQAILKSEYYITDSNLIITIEDAILPQKVFTKAFQLVCLKSIYSCLNGIYRMSSSIDGLVQTSNNLARVLINDGNYSIQCLTRSSVDSEKIDLANSLQACFELMGATISFGGSYPGWAPNKESSIVKLMSDLYLERYNENALVSACHAGLECGILGTYYPHIEMISFGPNIKGAHSPDEKCQISSVQKYWGFLLETLVRIPLSN
jgi:dipeptidase D